MMMQQQNKKKKGHLSHLDLQKWGLKPPQQQQRNPSSFNLSSNPSETLIQSI